MFWMGCYIFVACLCIHLMIQSVLKKHLKNRSWFLYHLSVSLTVVPFYYVFCTLFGSEIILSHTIVLLIMSLVLGTIASLTAEIILDFIKKLRKN